MTNENTTSKSASIEERLAILEDAVSALQSGKPQNGDLVNTIHSHLQELFPSRFPKLPENPEPAED